MSAELLKKEGLVSTIELEFNNYEGDFFIFRYFRIVDAGITLHEVSLDCFSASRDLKIRYPEGSDQLSDFALTLLLDNLNELNSLLSTKTGE